MSYEIRLPEGFQKVATNTEKHVEKLEAVKMIVTAMKLENFKAFEDSGWIDFNRITMFFGNNSAGKSTIFQALFFIRIIVIL